MHIPFCFWECDEKDNELHTLNVSFNLHYIKVLWYCRAEDTIRACVGSCPKDVVHLSYTLFSNLVVRLNAGIPMS